MEMENENLPTEQLTFKKKKRSTCIGNISLLTSFNREGNEIQRG